jgi:predicted extracellular nuclease
MLAMLFASSLVSAQVNPVINEFVFNHTGTDTYEYVEIYGAPSTNYSQYMILQIEGDSTGAGTIDSVFAVGSTGVNGFWATEFFTNKLENGTVTLLLVSNFFGGIGQDIDIDNDGVIDYAPWASIVDSVSVTDGGLDDRVYGETVLFAGYDGLASAPGGASRIPDGIDTPSVMDWVRNDFDGEGLPGFTGTPDASEAINTPGTSNQLVLATIIILNEVDSDTLGTDALEFIELYDGGRGNTPLNGLVVVLYNGNGDTSYQAFDLDGYTTDANGYFVLGNALVPNVGFVFPGNTLQNGADAVALYFANATDFPTGTPLTTLNLIDAVVYGTSDPDDPELLVLLNSGQPQVDENGLGDQINDSNQRCPNGSGGRRNTESYVQAAPTPGATNSCTGLELRIHNIQGAAHKSPYDGQAVAGVPGIVTAISSNGFYMQDPQPDADPATSEGIFIYTASLPPVSKGDSLLVGGNVQEFYPGGFSTGNLSITEITAPQIAVVSTGNPLPPPVVIGTAGRIPPSMIIEDDATGDVETTGVFDPLTDGIDFYESLEGMLVQVNDAVAVGPTSSFGEIPVVGDTGVNAGILNSRGALVIRSNDFNPERIHLDGAILPLPEVSVGSKFTGSIVGVMDYSFGNFKLLATEIPTPTASSLMQETTAPRGLNELSVATFNLENLDPGDGPSKFQKLALQIKNNLLSPDIIGVQEIQDNSGPTDNGVVDASLTYTTLINAILAAGGPQYAYKDIPPVDGADGGEPGGNIRVGFLYRPDRVSFVEHPGGNATTATAAILGPTGGVELSFSPGRIDPNNPAFASSRKPLAGEFIFKGNKVFVIVNHFVSKGGDSYLFGRIQPPVFASETQRNAEAQAVHAFVQSILTLDANAKVLVLGDLNDFQFTLTLSTLKGGILFNLIDNLPQEERYSYVFEGNAETLDHILVSANLNGKTSKIDVVHLNAEFLDADRPTDHDPVIVAINLEPADVCECDLNKDGKCNILDYQLFIQDWGRTNCGTPPGSGTLPNDCECDLNKDGKCNILDYQVFIQDWGRSDCPIYP